VLLPHQLRIVVEASDAVEGGQDRCAPPSQARSGRVVRNIGLPCSTVDGVTCAYPGPGTSGGRPAQCQAPVSGAKVAEAAAYKVRRRGHPTYGRCGSRPNVLAFAGADPGAIPAG
jgi:hypothetical protein